MQITIFQEITTASVLASFAEKAESYTDLYVDMNDKEQRKFVKGQADDINSILKKLDRARIDKTKESKKSIDDEFYKIVESLNKSNLPFTLLIDEYKAERKRILDEEKAAQKAKDDYFQMGIDHQDAINENELHDLRVEKNKREQEESNRLLLAQAEADKEQALINAENKRIADIEQAKIDERARAQAIIQKSADEQAQREANQAHVIATCKAAKECLMQHAGLSETDAVSAVRAIRAGLVAHCSIKF